MKILLHKTFMYTESFSICPVVDGISDDGSCFFTEQNWFLQNPINICLNIVEMLVKLLIFTLFNIRTRMINEKRLAITSYLYIILSFKIYLCIYVYINTQLYYFLENICNLEKNVYTLKRGKMYFFECRLMYVL